MVISAFNALTLSPALSAMILKPRSESKGLLARFFAAFNRGFARATHGYVDLSGRLIRKTTVSFLILAAFVVLAIVIGKRLPRIEGDPHQTCLRQRVIGDEAVDAVRQQHADPVAGAKAAVEKGVAQPVRQRVELAESHDALAFDKAWRVSIVARGSTDQRADLHRRGPAALTGLLSGAFRRRRASGASLCL